jgi:hypothetical protein
MASANRGVRGFSIQRHERSLGADFVDFARGLMKVIFDPYRPELHYMRGPGPKWHAKHNPAPVSYEDIAVPALVRIKAR